MGVGIDIGTMNIVSARMDKSNKMVFNRIRDTFLDVELEAKNMLKLRQTSFLELHGKCIIIGDEAVNVASIFNKNVRRPMEKGVISRDDDAQTVLAEIIRNVLGEPQEEGELCYYSVPAEAIDQDNKIVFHKKILAKIIANLDYTPVAVNEAHAICLAECANEGFSGLCISCGAGMMNICLTYATMAAPELQFSVAKSGDWIDTYTANSIGSTVSRVTQIKEKGINLKNSNEGDPRDKKVREALIFHYEQAIEDVLMLIKERFNTYKDRVNLPEAIPLIIAGGTAKPAGFLDLFKEVLGNIDDFPIPIKEVRLAPDPLTAIAKGLLFGAMSHNQ